MASDVIDKPFEACLEEDRKDNKKHITEEARQGTFHNKQKQYDYGNRHIRESERVCRHESAVC